MAELDKWRAFFSLSTGPTSQKRPGGLSLDSWSTCLGVGKASKYTGPEEPGQVPMVIKV